MKLAVGKDRKITPMKLKDQALNNKRERLQAHNFCQIVSLNITKMSAYINTRNSDNVINIQFHWEQYIYIYTSLQESRGSQNSIIEIRSCNILPVPLHKTPLLKSLLHTLFS